jgi:hypothetical protein
MNIDLHIKYGYCEIPIGTQLYHSGTGPNATDQLFFSTSYSNAWAWGGDMQLWTAKKKIKILFLLRHINAIGKGESSLPELYYEIYPNEPNKSLDDLDIKQILTRRDPFAKNLFTKHNILGWFSTIEDGRTDFEICLFNKKELLEHFECIPISRDAGDFYDQESLRNLDFFPNPTFVKKTRDLLLNEMEIGNHGKDPFKLHLSKTENLVNSCIKEGETKSKCENRFYDIRLKLGI